MPGFFISKLPSGHAVKDNTKAAAIASLRGDDIVKATPANTVPLLRQQCAAIVRLRRDVCTADNLEKLALADRAYLLKLCGLLCGGTSKAHSRRILDHLQLHSGDGGTSSGGGSGGPAPGSDSSSSGGQLLGQQRRGRRRRRRRRGGLYPRRSSLRPRLLHSIFSVGWILYASRTKLAYLSTLATMFRSCATNAASPHGQPSNYEPQQTFVQYRLQILRELWMHLASLRPGNPSRRIVRSKVSCEVVATLLGPGARLLPMVSSARSGLPYSVQW